MKDELIIVILHRIVVSQGSKKRRERCRRNLPLTLSVRGETIQQRIGNESDCYDGMTLTVTKCQKNCGVAHVVKMKLPHVISRHT